MNPVKQFIRFLSALANQATDRFLVQLQLCYNPEDVSKPHLRLKGCVAGRR